METSASVRPSFARRQLTMTHRQFYEQELRHRPAWRTRNISLCRGSQPPWAWIVVEREFLFFLCVCLVEQPQEGCEIT